MTIRTRNIFDPASSKPYKLSRSRLENFIRCPRCFYLDRRLGVDQPQGPPFTLNSAVDHLLKKEFDGYRSNKKPHPIMVEHSIEATPFSHPELDIWRENFKGIQFHHKPTNLIITGAVDDLWCKNDCEELIVVDYKATSKDGDIVFNEWWHEGYKRQMEIYQWLLRKIGFQVSSRGYFVYANALKTPNGLNSSLTFKIQLISHDGSDAWVEDAIHRAHACLKSDTLPQINENCDYCSYRRDASKLEK